MRLTTEAVIGAPMWCALLVASIALPLLLFVPQAAAIPEADRVAEQADLPVDVWLRDGRAGSRTWSCVPDAALQPAERRAYARARQALNEIGVDGSNTYLEALRDEAYAPPSRYLTIRVGALCGKTTGDFWDFVVVDRRTGEVHNADWAFERFGLHYWRRAHDRWVKERMTMML